MTTATAAAEMRLITHKDLPEDDGTLPTNYLEQPQTILLTGTMTPLLRRLYPDGRYSIGADNLIYYWMTNPPTRGARAPDWFLVVGVEPMLNGEFRRSYVLWDEIISPLIVFEYVSGDGTEERDRTRPEGKFWIYENAIKATYYVIHDGGRGILELYRRDGAGYHEVRPNERGHLPIPELTVELGLWRGTLNGTNGWYVRPFDLATGEMLPSWEEAAEAGCLRADEAESAADDMRRELADEAEQTRQARLAEEEARRLADEARRQADEARQKAERLAERLRQLGIDPEAA